MNKEILIRIRSARLYRMYFVGDFFADYSCVCEALPEIANPSEADKFTFSEKSEALETARRIIWTILYENGLETAPYTEWTESVKLDLFESFDLMSQRFQRDCQPIEPIYTKSSGESKPLSFSLLVKIGRNLGLSLADIDNLTPGMLLDFAIYETNMQSGDDKKTDVSAEDYMSF